MKQFKNISSLVIIILFMNLLPAQDWANLDRFKKDNMELVMPEPGKQRIVFMGNSITIGWLNSRPEFFQGKPFVNRGISGQTTPQMLIRFRQDVIDLKPAVVVILAGINDIAQNTGPITLEAIAGNIFSMPNWQRKMELKSFCAPCFLPLIFHGARDWIQLIK